MQVCDFLMSYTGTEEPVDVEMIVNHLFTIGEICMLGVEIDCDDKNAGIVDVPKQMVTFIQALLAPTLVQMGGGPATSIHDSIRAHAFIALGKICLRDSALAKTCITTFIKELETTDSPAIRNNIILVIGDLCRRYTGMVDRYVPNLAMCLRDGNGLVRQHSLMLLTQVT
jgi:condensin-2 complex subunit D3